MRVECLIVAKDSTVLLTFLGVGSVLVENQSGFSVGFCKRPVHVSQLVVARVRDELLFGAKVDELGVVSGEAGQERGVL